MTTSVEYIQGLCGRRGLDGHWDVPPAHARVREAAIDAARGDSTSYALCIRKDAIEAYRAARESALDPEGGLPEGFRAPGALAPETHRLEALANGEAARFKRASTVHREGKRLVRDVRASALRVGEALPLSLHAAMSMLSRYGLLLEPVPIPEPEPIKIGKPKTSGRRKSKDNK